MRELQDGPVTATDPQRIGDWTILARLGAGGMGVVYLAERDGARAAIKTIRRDLEVDPTFRKRFEREAAAVTSANSDRIARIIEADLDASPAYIAFQYYDGPNLREVIQEGGALEPSALQALAVGLAEGLEAIHAEGVVHRDIKPSNVIMTARGPVIIDFGIAAYEASELTQLTTTGEPIGSPTWMSPEYITTGQAAEPGDVFGWAATIQFAATGQPPFGMGATQPLLYRITNVEAAPHGISGVLGRLVTQALSKRPVGRPSPGEILQALLRADPQTGSTQRLRLPLPAPITAGHQMNIGTAPITSPPPPVSDTLTPPPPPARPPTRPPTKSRSPLVTVLAVLGIGGVVVVGLLGALLVVRAPGGGSAIVQELAPAPTPIGFDGPMTVPTPNDFDGPMMVPTPISFDAPSAPVPLGIVSFTYGENNRDTVVLQEHVALVPMAFDDDGRPRSDPADISDRLTAQIKRFDSNQVPTIVPTKGDLAEMDHVAIMERRADFQAISLYPDMVDFSVRAATGRSAPGSTTSTVASILTVMVEGAMRENSVDGLGAAAPAITDLNRDLEDLAAIGTTELSDPDVQAAFGRFVVAIADQIATPRIN